MKRSKAAKQASATKVESKAESTEETRTEPEASKPPHKLSRNKIVAIVLAVLTISIGVTTYAIMQRRNAVNESSQAASSKVIGDKDLLRGRVFARYQQDAAYVKGADGKPKTFTDEKGVFHNVRNKTFAINLERDGKTHDITLDDKITAFGLSTDGNFYSLTCSVPARGQPGADNASYTAQFYDRDGRKLNQATWKQQDTTRPVGVNDQYCPELSGNSYFDMNSIDRANFSPRGYGRKLVDALNYKIVFTKSNGQLQDVDTETEADIDLPLGATPDKKIFLYNRVSAKRSEAGCGEETALAYKVVDFAGPINELHAVDLTTGQDTLVGTEKSFAYQRYEINLSEPGHFSSDSGRYYLREGNHGGCGMGDSKPIRIAYINLKTMQLETISSPAGKEYSQYGFTENGKYIMESGAVDDYDIKTPPKVEEAPTILDTRDSSTFQIPGVSVNLDWIAGSHLPNVFVGLNRAKEIDENGNLKIDTPVKGLTILDPAKKSVKNVVFATSINHGMATDIFSTNDPTIGYMLSNTYDGNLNTTVYSTTLFSFNTGKTADVPYAQIIL